METIPSTSLHCWICMCLDQRALTCYGTFILWWGRLETIQKSFLRRSRIHLARPHALKVLEVFLLPAWLQEMMETPRTSEGERPLQHYTSSPLVRLLVLLLRVSRAGYFSTSLPAMNIALLRQLRPSFIEFVLFSTACTTVVALSAPGLTGASMEGDLILWNWAV